MNFSLGAWSHFHSAFPLNFELPINALEVSVSLPVAHSQNHL